MGNTAFSFLDPGSLAMRLAVVLFCISLINACSWTFVTSVADTTVDKNVTSNCTTSSAWPIVDTLFAGISGAMGGVYTTVGIMDPDSDFVALPGGILYLAMATVYGLSAWSGYRDTAHCRSSNKAAEHPL